MKEKSEKKFSSKEQRSLAEVITFLRNIADNLEKQGFVPFEQDKQQVEAKPEGDIELETEYKVKGRKHKIEIEIEWKDGSTEGSAEDSTEDSTKSSTEDLKNDSADDVL